MRSKGDATTCSSVAITPFSMRSSKKAMSSAQRSSTLRNRCLRNASASATSPSRSQNAISGSTIQNSARWRLVFEFSARKVGPKV